MASPGQFVPVADRDLLPRAIEGAPADDGLAVVRPPEVVLEEARRAAKALKGVIDAKPKKIFLNDEQYLEFEDWQTVGRFYGIVPRIRRTQHVVLGSVEGWEAYAVAVHVASGRVVSSAESMCMNDEEKWRARPKYEYHYVTRSGGTSAEDPGSAEIVWEKTAQGKNRPKKQRVLAGEEPVPTFQLRSMAQTRAGAKAMRNALAWVVVLAGYKPTPAEELPPEAMHREQATTAESATFTDAEPAEFVPMPGRIHQPEVTTLWKLANKNGWTKEHIGRLLGEFQVSSVDQIPMARWPDVEKLLSAAPTT